MTNNNHKNEGTKRRKKGVNGVEGQENVGHGHHERSNLLAMSNGKNQPTSDYRPNLQIIGDQNDGVDEPQILRQKRPNPGEESSDSVAVSEIMEEISNLDPNNPNGHSSMSHQRRLWVKDRSQAWWEEWINPEFPEEEFRKWFRMGKSTFELICDELNSSLVKEGTPLRPAIPVKQRVAVCLYRLATGEPLRSVSNRFGLGISTCHKLVLEVCNAIKSVLMPKYLQWPNNESSLKKIKEKFESISGIPKVVGSMYTTHTPIIADNITDTVYFNKLQTERTQKASYSVTIQGVVDPNGLFTDVCIGWPGSMSNDKLLQKSALYQRAFYGILKGNWIVGGVGYPLMDWLLVPYNQKNLTWTQHNFNEKMGEVEKVAKDAFARLKGRWCSLQRLSEVNVKDLPVVLGACCVLHNICEVRGEEMDSKLGFEIFDDEKIPEIPLQSLSLIGARDAIAHNLLHHGDSETGLQ